MLGATSHENYKNQCYTEHEQPASNILLNITELCSHGPNAHYTSRNSGVVKGKVIPVLD
jgi:hypothetical protein